VFKEHYGDVNTKRAKLLLKEAGYSSGNPLKLELWYPSSSSIRRDVAHTLRDWVDQELEGILKLEVHSIGSEVYLDNIGKGFYSTFLLDWSPDFLDPDNYVQPFLECLESSAEGRCNQGGSKTFGSFYYNEKVNQLIKSEQKEQDSQSRKAVFTEIQDISATHIPYIPLWESKNYVFANDNLLGVNLDLTNVLSLWTIKKEN
jgi:peptide/nickel transport system substrate-binding protein